MEPSWIGIYGTGTEAHNLGSGGKYVGYCFEWAYQRRTHLIYYNRLKRSKRLECQYFVTQGRLLFSPGVVIIKF